jgi:hypothetical protein
MRSVIILVVITVIAYNLSAQVPVQKDLMQMLGKIPSPPTTVKDAFAKIGAKNSSGELNCSADKLFKSIEEDVKGVEAEFKAQPRPDASSVVPGLSSEDAKKMSSPEMKKKMKKMSKEEKMKMAMEMMNSMSPGTPVTESDPPLVRAALDEWQIIYNDTQNEFQRSVNEQQEEAKAAEEYEKSHSEVNSWEAAEIAKLPQISTGEMSAADPVKVKTVKLKSADKHITITNKRLEQIRSKWRESADHANAKYSKFYQKLIAANYAVDSKNFSTKKILADAQISILQLVAHQMKQSRNAWEESASWQARRINIENQ